MNSNYLYCKDGINYFKKDELKTDNQKALYVNFSQIEKFVDKIEKIINENKNKIIELNLELNFNENNKEADAILKILIVNI